MAEKARGFVRRALFDPKSISQVDLGEEQLRDPTCLTEQQHRIIGALQPAGEIARVFQAGAQIRNSKTFPARGYFLGHAMREILNRLPDYYEGAASTVDVTEEIRKPSSQQINALWTSWSEAVGGQFATSEGTPVPIATDDLSIPFSIASEINSYLLTQVSVSRSRRERLTTFLAIFQNTDRVFMADIADGLMRLEPDRLAHVPKPGGLRDEAESIEKWDHFERILLGLRGARHERYPEIIKEVDEWNSL